MSSLATFKCYSKSWIAEQVYGESPRHLEIAAGAHKKGMPYCRKHLLGTQQKNKDILPEGFRKLLIAENFDLSPEFDLLVVQHDINQEPQEELTSLQYFGRQILSLAGNEVPDFAYLDNIESSGSSRLFTDTYLSPSDIDDLVISRRALTKMMLGQFND